MRLKQAWAAVVSVGLVACGETLEPNPLTPSIGQEVEQPEPTPPLGRYIVVFKAGAGDPGALTDQLMSAHGGEVHFRYGSALQGFAATLPASALEGIRRNPNVEFVEADGIASVMDTVTSPRSWGLDRVDQRDLGLDLLYATQNEGAGVRVYIIDTGVRFDHVELSGRAASGWDFIDGDDNASDCHGHGTHVAGTVAGASVGVAAEASILAVRVLGCTGRGLWSQVIAGIDWVAANHVKPAVANMSLSGAASGAVNAAVATAVASGVTFAVAAGNDDTDACSRSPASAASALTVGATTIFDARASFSNWGGCVDLFAPGDGIVSSTLNGAYASWSGTSMAAPHVAGAAALYLAFRPEATPADVAAAILDGATLDRLSGSDGAPNRLLYSLIAGPGALDQLPPLPPPAPPVDVFVADLDGTPTGAKGGWSAEVSILVRDGNGVPVVNASVAGSWSEGATGSGSCLTGSDGRCTVNRSNLKKKVQAVQFTVGSVKAANGVYTPSANTDPDGDSDGTAITVSSRSR